MQSAAATLVTRGSIIDFGAGGVSSFRVTGINPTVDSGLPDAFPTFLNFVGVSGSFDMVPLDTTVPEPSALLVAAAPLALLMLRRRRKS